MSKRDRRVAARTKATTSRAGEQGEPVEQADANPRHQDVPCAEPAHEPAEQDAPVAKVIPLGIFDPFTEADKRW